MSEYDTFVVQPKIWDLRNKGQNYHCSNGMNTVEAEYDASAALVFHWKF